MTLIVDSSMALAWCFEDEQTASVMTVLDRVTEGGAIVPQLWPYEVLNGLFVAERRRRLDRERRRLLAKSLQSLPIEIDEETVGQAWGPVTSIAEKFGLTSYDAAYLELAQRRKLPLASLDQDMCSAGQALGIALL